MSSSKCFLKICEEFFDILHPNVCEDENIELIKYHKPKDYNKPKETNDSPDSLCDTFLNYIIIRFLYICSYFDSKPNNEIKYHVC